MIFQQLPISLKVFGRRAFGLVLSLLIGASAGAQTITTISCDSLMKLPFVGFEPDRLPQGFLDCFGGNPADIISMKKWMQILSSSGGDDYTVGDMKHVLDSMDQATGYRQAGLKIDACRELYRRALNPANWTKDSADLERCGLQQQALGFMSSMVREGKTQEGWTLSSLSAAYARELPELLRQEAAAHSSHCQNTEYRKFSFDLRAYEDPDSAMACAREKGLPVLFIFASWMNTVTRRTEEITLRELDLFSRINRETVLLVLYADDPSPLENEKQFVGTAEGKTVSNRGELAVELAYRYLKIKNPPGLALVNPEGKVLYSIFGEPTRDDFFKLLDSAKTPAGNN